MAVEFKDYYKTLGVARDAGQEDIRKSFRKLARQYHPDVAKDKKKAEEKFKEINEAYEVLGDPEKRKKYDTLGANWNQAQPPPGWQQGGRGSRPGQNGGEPFEFQFGGTGFSDFFEQFFGGASSREFGGARRSRGGRGHVEAGADIEGDLLATLHEAFSGSVRTISLQRLNRETGEAATESFRVRIPVGVQEGQLIRVPGKGEQGSNGGPPGDLYLRVRFAQHPDFRVRGADLHCDLDLAPWEAALGATVSIPALDGAVSVRVPAGSLGGQQLRVRGKGLPAEGGARGDLYAVMQIQMPPSITDEERALWSQLASRSAFNPRRQ